MAFAVAVLCTLAITVGAECTLERDKYAEQVANRNDNGV